MGQRERRKARLEHLAKLPLEEMTLTEIARAGGGMDESTAWRDVQHLGRTYKARPRGKPERRHPWEEIDWSRRSCDIARELGVARSQVSRARKRYESEERGEAAKPPAIGTEDARMVDGRPWDVFDQEEWEAQQAEEKRARRGRAQELGIITSA